VILVNKVDLVSRDTLAETEQLICKVNPVAPMYQTVRGEIDLKCIIGISAYAPVPQVREQMSMTTESCSHQSTGEKSNETSKDNHLHRHDTEITHYTLRGISSLQVTFPILTRDQLDRFDAWIRTVLWENQLPASNEQLDIQVLRCKGVFTLDTGEQYVLQGVRSMYELEKLDIKVEDILGIPDPGKVVLIGKNLTDVVRRNMEDVLTNNT
jgi:G3E family GTPase